MREDVNTIMQIICVCKYVIFYYQIFTDNEKAKFYWFMSFVTWTLLCLAIGVFPL